MTGVQDSGGEDVAHTVPTSLGLEEDSLEQRPVQVRWSCAPPRRTQAEPCPAQLWSHGAGLWPYQLLELPLPVTELLVHALAHTRALQGRDDLQLGVVVVNDVVLQHQAQDLQGAAGGTLQPVRDSGQGCPLQAQGAKPSAWPSSPTDRGTGF